MTEREQNQVSAALADAAMGVRPQDQNMPQHIGHHLKPASVRQAEERDPVALATFVGRDQQAKRDAAEKAKAALLNPPRQDPQPDMEQPAMDPVHRQILYIAAKKQLDETLTSLHFRIKNYGAQVTVDDLATIYNYFDHFMNTHPLFNPEALAARAKARALAVHPSATNTQIPTALSQTIPRELHVLGNDGPTQLFEGNLPPVSDWVSVPVPPAVGGMVLPRVPDPVQQPNLGQTYSAQRPNAPIAPTIGPEDSAAIARAKAALMAGIGQASLGTGNNFAVLQLLQALNNVGLEEVGGNLQPNIHETAKLLSSLLATSLKKQVFEPSPDAGYDAVPPFTRSLEEKLFAVTREGEARQVEYPWPESDSYGTESDTSNEDGTEYN